MTLKRSSFVGSAYLEMQMHESQDMTAKTAGEVRPMRECRAGSSADAKIPCCLFCCGEEQSVRSTLPRFFLVNVNDVCEEDASTSGNLELIRTGPFIGIGSLIRYDSALS